jgi:hypothetical protein
MRKSFARSATPIFSEHCGARQKATGDIEIGMAGADYHCRNDDRYSYALEYRSERAIVGPRRQELKRAQPG